MDTMTFIRENWKNTARLCRESHDGNIGLPYPYFVPSITGGFNNLFYWDSYFTAQGMLRHGQEALVKSTVDDMLYLIDRYGYMPNGIRVNFFEKERGAKRAVDMLIKKLNDQPFVTEYPMPSFDRVAPNPAVKDLSHAVIALCTSGGIVPKGNPDHIESSSASHYGEYNIAGVEKLTKEAYETAHGGYDPVYANDDPNRVLPVDVMRELEKEGVIGKLHDYFYTTVGNGTAVANAKRFAAEYAQKLKQAGVQAVIMTST